MSRLSFHIVGDSFVDLFCYLQDDWPEQGGDACLEHPIREMAGGSSTNTATYLSSLRRSEGDMQPAATLHTVYNPNDTYGKILEAQSNKYNYALLNCRSEDETSSTGHCVVVVSRQDRSFMTHRGCVDNFEASHLHMDVMMNESEDLHVHVAGYFNLPGFWNGKLLEQLVKLRQTRSKRALRNTTTISLVPQHDATKQWDGGIKDLVPHLDFLFMNEVEARCIAMADKHDKKFNDGDGQIEAFISYYSNLSPSTVFVITRGPQGAIAFSNGKMIASMKAVPVDKVEDPTGAGDAFVAGFLHGFWSEQGHSTLVSSSEKIIWSEEAVKQGLYWGCACGTASVQVRGASVPPPKENIEAIFDRQSEIKSS